MAAITVTDPSHASHLVEEFVAMREAGELFDYVIRGSSDSFSIHSLVFASMSPVFKTMLQSKLDDTAKNEVKFPTIPDSTMKNIIDFAYTGICTFNRNELMPLIEAAHFLQMGKLLKICDEQISKVLNPSNCFSWFRVATRLELGAVIPQIEKMMSSACKEVIQSEDFKDAQMSEVAEYLISLIKKTIHSNTLAQAILHWIKHDSHNRAVHMAELFEFVSLGKCTKSFLSEMVTENVELFDTQQEMYKLILMETMKEEDTKLSEKLLVVGGQSGRANKVCWMLDENKLVKFAEASGQQLEIFHSVCQVPQGVMLTGGWESSMCKLFDIATTAWMDRANLLSNRRRHGSGYTSGKVFVIGGHLNSQESRSVDYMDLDSDIWQHGPSIPDIEYDPKVAVCDCRLYVLLSTKGILYCLEIDGSELSWKTKARIPQASAACSITAVDDKLFAAGGFNSINCVYTPTTDTWCSLTGPKLQEGHGSLVYYRKKLLLICGCNFGSQLEVEEYDISSNKWTLAEWKLPKALILFGAFVFQLPK